MKDLRRQTGADLHHSMAYVEEREGLPPRAGWRGARPGGRRVSRRLEGATPFPGEAHVAGAVARRM